MATVARSSLDSWPNSPQQLDDAREETLAHIIALFRAPRSITYGYLARTDR